MSAKAVDDCCATHWPLLFVHGVGFHDSGRYRYWGRVPETLVEHGACVRYGFQDSWGTCESNARTLRVALFNTVTQLGCEKVNIIAHSKGGLDARVLASMEDCAPHIASITTIASPHAGSRTMDALMRIPAPLFKAGAVLVNGVFRLMGDVTPDFYTVCSQLTTKAMRGFNEAHPAADALFCQSYAAAMSRARDDVVMAFSYLIVRHFDGPNDGLVALASTPFGEFKGVVGAAGPRDTLERGISHTDVIDLRRRSLKTRAGRAGGAGGRADARSSAAAESATDGVVAAAAPDTKDARFDIVDWYVRLVADLKARGL